MKFALRLSKPQDNKYQWYDVIYLEQDFPFSGKALRDWESQTEEPIYFDSIESLLAYWAPLCRFDIGLCFCASNNPRNKMWFYFDEFEITNESRRSFKTLNGFKRAVKKCLRNQVGKSNSQ